MKKTMFTYHEWHWTQANENLFDLDKENLLTYRLLIQVAA